MHTHYCPIFPLEAEGNAHDGRFSKFCFYSNNQRTDVVTGKFLSQYLEGIETNDLDRVTKTRVAAAPKTNTSKFNSIFSPG